MKWVRVQAVTATAIAIAAFAAGSGVFSQAASPALTELSYGGIRGGVMSPFAAHKDGDTYEYSEDVVVLYDRAVDFDSFKAHLSIAPDAPFSVYPYKYGTAPKITVRKTPGVVYTLTIAAGVQAKDGSVDGESHVFHFTTDAHVPHVAPLRSTPGEPYRYGTLGHPFPGCLVGANADRQIALDAEAGVRFVRIDYTGDQSEHVKGTFDFTIQDRIMDKLVAAGITELPIIDQYSAPQWANGGKSYPNIWSSPRDYADFAAAVAQHVAQKYPMIGRIELFNEPNLHGWWTYPVSGAEYDDLSGKATGVYMKAAYEAVKKVAPGLTIVGPALSSGGRHTKSTSFLAAMYTAGCRRGDGWDVLSFHNYSWGNPDNPLTSEDRFDGYKDIQAVAAAHGDANAHVMLTEWGYSSANTALGFDPAVEAYYIALGLNKSLADPTVDGIVYVNIWNPGDKDDFWGHTPVVTADGTKLPGFYVLREFSKGEKVAEQP